MSLIRWSNKQDDGGKSHSISPWSDMRQEFDRVFDQFVDSPLGFMTRPFSGAMHPSVDVAEKDEEVIVRAELPGVEPDKIDLSLAENTITLSGEKIETHEESEGEFYRKESRYGSFRRSIPLPCAVDSESADAEFKNGVLTVRLKKHAGAKRQKIAIRSGEQPG
ncbi:MAG: Hsp20/alpha crystallin family protein [Pirellulales bacterium]|nr:Hsp20/alpha crystallin family protein [Pirellulales bacterium]